MKKIKYFIIGALMTIISAPVMAQAQQDEIMSQVSEILKSGAPDAAKQVAAIAKLNKKNADALVSIGKAYLAAKNYAEAQKYGEQAIKADSKNGKGYILLGNIAVAQDDGGNAASWFQQAIMMDPKNPDGYRRYAQIMSKLDPNGAVQTLEDLRAQRPDYPVDLIAAEIYTDAGKIAKANEYYAKVNVADMKEYQISSYATNLFLLKEYDKSLEIASAGHAKYPRNASFNRLLMFNHVEKENFEAACAAGSDFVNNSDSLKMSVYDYNYYGRALEGAKKFDEAIALYKKLDQDENIAASDKVAANMLISECYKKVSNYALAAEYLDKFVKSQSETSFGLEESVAKLYSDQLKDDKTSDADKRAAYDKADAAYAALGEKYPAEAAYIALTRARLPFSLPIQNDLEKLKIAGPHYVTLANILGAKADRSAPETKIYKDALNFSSVYYVHCMDDMEKAKEFATKLLEIDPENANAKAILGQ